MRSSRVSHWLLAGSAIVLLGATAGACKKDDKTTDEKASNPGGMVTVAAEGSKFEPPVKKDQIPDGAWMCDMGTVHFAASEKGKGTCDLCGMPLVEKAPAAVEKAPAADEKAPTADEKAPAADEKAPPAP